MKKGIILILISCFIAGLYIAYPYYKVYSVLDFDNTAFQEPVKSFPIEEEISFKNLGSLLKENQIINDVEAFNLLVEYKKGYSDAIMKPGRIKIDKDWTNNKMVNQLYLMRNQEIVSVLVPSVKKLEELPAIIASYISANEDELISLLNDSLIIKKYGFTRETFPTMFLPNTYEMYSFNTAEDFIELMAKEYKAFWNTERKEKATKINLTQSEVVILASMVLEEQRVKYYEHPTIAGVYINRLQLGMKLQSCPTVIYALNEPGLRRVLKKHLEIESPYNTYINFGLPPGPICIPEPRVIDAVLNYEAHDYLFMCAKPEYSGDHQFSKTNAEHSRYSKIYSAWADKEGLK